MKVKRLEVQGFKSFKDKTILHFDHAITGIVGPNGCGKSNIVDAFFWVMGEQSNKHMRATGSHDLIFNGSSKYSALGFAEATLVLEEAQVDETAAPSGASAKDDSLPMKTREISVTRRVYSSGEGEYLINGMTARLRDIHELFMDTGIGAKGYSIIAQGEIQKIVNAKPEERRQLIEEAAGIAKYKARKRESLRKMEVANENLARLRDILQEIERNIASLERQAQKASQYKKLKEELMHKELRWGRGKYGLLTKKTTETSSLKKDGEERIAIAKARISQLDLEIQSQEIVLLEDSKKIEAMLNEAQGLSDQFTQSKSAAELSEQRQQDLTLRIESLKTELENILTSTAEEKSRAITLDEEASGFEGNFQAAVEKTQSLRSSTQAAEADYQRFFRDWNERQWELNQKIQQELSQAETQSSTIQVQLLHSEEQMGRVEAALTETLESEQTLRDSLVQGRSELETAQQKQVQLNSEKSRLDGEVSTLRKNQSEAQLKSESIFKEWTLQQSQKESLESLEAALEGYSSGPKRVIQLAQKSSKSLAPIAQALQIRTGYERAAEVALAPLIESLHSEDLDFSISALQQLEQEKNGRASIWIGDAASMETSLENPQNLSRLSEFVDFQGSQPALKKWLDGVLVVENLQALRPLLTDAVHSLSLNHHYVSKDGFFYDKSGFLRGGAIEESVEASLIGRRREIERLTGEAEMKEQAWNESKLRQTEIESAIRENAAELERVQIELNQVVVEIASLQKSDVFVENSLRETAIKISKLQQEQSQLEQGRSNLNSSLEENRERVSHLQERKLSLQQEIDQLSNEVTTRKQSSETAQQLLQEQLLKEATLKERKLFLQREIDSIQSILQEKSRREAEIRQQMERTESDLEILRAGKVTHLQQIEQVGTELRLLREKISFSKTAGEEVQSKITSMKQETKSYQGEHQTLADDLQRYSLELEKIQLELDFFVNNLEEKYGKGCIQNYELQPQQGEFEDPIVSDEMRQDEEALLQEEVERLREKMRRLGEVNPNAIEEYEQQKMRLDHLSTEKQDLERSIQDLEDAIDHINQTSKERFQKTFEAISSRFEKLFPIVFGGGQAKLSMVFGENSTDILEAGIDILAQPPGKKIVNMGLLSGGEKALTAVSLIFAIFMVKPSPFCILDEVDAPLDDANIGKFNALLREMSAKSQFIVITHNKKTMELNDTLYGVTMEEPGVSKMVSIRITA